MHRRMVVHTRFLFRQDMPGRIYNTIIIGTVAASVADIYAPHDGASFIDLKRREKLMDKKKKLEVTLLKKSDCFDNLNTRKQIIYDISCKSKKIF